MNAGNCGTAKQIGKHFGIPADTMAKRLRRLQLEGFAKIVGEAFEADGRGRAAYVWGKNPAFDKPSVPLVQSALASRSDLQLAWMPGQAAHQGARA